MKKFIKLAVLAVFMFVCSTVYGGERDLTFTWTKDVIEEDLAGFTLHEYQIIDGEVVTGRLIDIPYTGETDFLHAEVITLPNGSEYQYCYTVSAYDTSDNKSGESNQACVKIDFLAPGGATEFTVTIKVVSK